MTFACSTPELILVNGNVRTQDPGNPAAQAVAVGAGRILAVGSDASIRAMAGPGTRVIDLGGRLTLPGMTDAHFHYHEWALNRRHLALAGAVSLDDLLRQVADRAQRSHRGAWILGQGWNEADWPAPDMPLVADLDRVSPHHPVVLWRCDLHLAAANTLALAAAGIQEHSPGLPEGTVERDPKGRPTGILREQAIDRVRAAVPRPTEAEMDRAMQDSLPLLHRMGLTGIHDVRLMDDRDGAAALGAWQRLEAAAGLHLRCWVTLPGERLAEAAALGLRTGFGSDRLRIGHLKFFADGGMGARTAWLTEPYLDAGCGMPLTPMADLSSAVEQADAAGLSVMIHAIGDRANRELIDLFERHAGKAATGSGGAAVPHRIEHVQMIRPEDIPRLARLNLTACVQPHNMILDINMIDACVGPRGRWTYPFQALITAGVRVLFSSDAPVADPGPLVGIHAAVTRQRADGTPSGGWHPEHRVSVADAVRAYTLAPAIAHGTGHLLGSITPGKLADLVVLDRDIYTVAPNQIRDTVVVLTLFNGRIVHRGGI